MPDDPTVELGLARNLLADADAMRGRVTDRSIVNRLYYASFHAAQAVLYDRGFDPQTHDAVKRLFGREVVVAGQATKSDGSFLSNIYDLRTDADYEQEPIDVNVDSLYTRTEMFVEDMADVLEEGKNDSED